MCKHILNAQVQIRAPCCRTWFDCSECHAEASDHKLAKSFEMVFGCKKCKKVFRKDTNDFDKSDEFCPRCDNHFVLPARTKENNMPMPEEEVDLRKDNNLILDSRVKNSSIEAQLQDFDYSELLG